MDTTNYVALSSQMALRRQMDLIANNLANMNTSGYQRESAIFEAYIDKQDNNVSRPTRPVAFVLDQGTARDLSHGDLKATDNPLDVAITGNGYFAVQQANGATAYTRDGSFQIAVDGTLTTKTGEAVLDINNSPIKISRNETDIRITDDGTLTTNQGARGQIQLVQFDNEYSLNKIGGTLLTANGATAAPVARNQVQLKTGVIEGSNVKPVLEMTQMMQVLRSYQSITGMMDRYEDMRSQALQQLGRVQ